MRIRCSIQVPSELLARKKNDSSVYWKSLPLRPGLYKIDIVIKDVNNPDHIGRWERSSNVPRYDDDRLASSSLILAGQMDGFLRVTLEREICDWGYPHCSAGGQPGAAFRLR